MSGFSQILDAIQNGDTRATEKLFPIVYDELRRLANREIAGEAPGHTLGATALVHEAYLRLVGDNAEACWENRGHFFGAAAQAMRRILIESARRKRRLRHGGGKQRCDFVEGELEAPEADDSLIALDEALTRFADKDPLKARLVELRYFAGLTGADAARMLGISPSSADRYWIYAKAWLRREIQGSDSSEKKSK